MSEISAKEKLYHEMVELEEKAKQVIEESFIPWDKNALPFLQQKAYFRDTRKTKLLRTGNRAAKTFSTNRDLAWKIMRNHPFRKDWREDYNSSQPKKFWLIGPTFEFLTETCWGQYLSRFIPPWYYTNEAGEMMTLTKRFKNYEYIDKVFFRNGDTLEIKTYSQNLLSLMGRAIDVAVLDEMPPKLMIISEIITRVLDKGGEMDMGFTPLNPDPEIQDYLENHPTLATHTWPLLANPLYANDPEKYKRVIAEWSHLPKAEKEARLNGDWYFEQAGVEHIFQNCTPEIVGDFLVPSYWRQVRVVDPASHVSGFAIFAENSTTHEWYVIHAGEIYWKDKIAKAEDIVRELDRYKPFPDFQYTLSLYDNAEAWFGVYAGTEWRPCMEKNKLAQIQAMRDMMIQKQLRFFKIGAAAALRQIYNYRSKDGKIVKKNDHIVDAIQYFVRQVPKAIKMEFNDFSSTDKIIECHFKNLRNKWSKNSKSVDKEQLSRLTKPMFYAQHINSRRAR